MARITYLGEQPTEWRGTRFEPGKAVTVEDEAFIEKAKGNRYFKVTGAGKSEPEPDPNEDQAAPETIARIGLPAGDAGDPSFVGSGGIAPDDRPMPGAGEDIPADIFVGAYDIQHKGRGKYDVLQDGEVVQSGLSRPDAEEWVKARSA